MASTLLAVLPLVSACVCQVFLGIYTAKAVVWEMTRTEATFTGADLFYGDIARAASKYPLSVYPPPIVGLVLRTVTIFWNIAGMIFVIDKSLSGNPFQLPPKFFIAWSGVWILTTFWVFMFDGERHRMATTASTLAHVLSCLALEDCRQVYQNSDVKKGQKTHLKKDHDRLFRYLILEALGILSVWSLIAASLSISMLLVYEESLHSDVAILSGLLTEEEGSTVAMIIILFVVAVWWILDITYCRGKLADSVQFAHPVLTTVALSMLFQNYKHDKGMTMCNWLCAALSISSCIAFLSRKIQKNFIVTRQSMESKRHHE